MKKLLDKIIAHEDKDIGIHAGEAYILWTQLQARYDTLELTEMILNFAKDIDFKTFVERGITTHIRPQIAKLEETVAYYRVPYPPQPPKTITLTGNMEEARDEAMFRVIFSGSQAALLIHIKAINLCTNDSLRNMFEDFLNDELKMYNSIIKYGKTKGWVHAAPQYRH